MAALIESEDMIAFGEEKRYLALEYEWNEKQR
jgi:hypothetical protein